MNAINYIYFPVQAILKAMIQAQNICLSFGTQDVFDQISFNFNQHQRIGLVGRNGSGKSTLLKAINNPSTLDEGTISVPKNKKIAYMPQDVVLLSDKTILDETFSTFAHITALQDQARELEKRIETNADEKTLQQYADVQTELTETSPEQARAETKKILMGLGFTEEQFTTPVSTLSVGWKMRIVLAKLLLQKADFYLFDEPTNHLDLGAKEWFLSFLKRSSFGCIIVCHERYFLEELCTHTFELEQGKGTMYTGGYSVYERQKADRLEQLRSAYEQQQRDIKSKMATIERFRASASKSRMAQSMLKQLNKVERITMPPSLKEVSFSFEPVEMPGRTVLTVTDVAHAFGDKEIFKNVNFEVEREDKVALIAPNGGGKTTLFNIITGKLPLQAGTVTFGHHVKHSIFDQDQNLSLDVNNSILENVSERCNKSLRVIRTFLGSFLFSNDDVNKKVQVLSGGEKNRVGMVCTLLQNANLLLLDEPTNHLDIQSKEVLLKALKEFRGTIIFVSHDRDFVNDLATHVVELTPTSAKKYHGNYRAYLTQKSMTNDLTVDASAQQSSAQSKAKQAKADSGLSKKQLFELRKKSKRLEHKIEKLEKEITQVGIAFELLEYGTPEFITMQEKITKLKAELEECEGRWEEAEQWL